MYDPETRETARRGILARLEAAIDAIHDSDDFRRYLQVQARFHSYSFRNTLLIALQCPIATAVAGYTAWQAIGR